MIATLIGLPRWAQGLLGLGALIGALALMGLVVLGLSLRNAIRNIKGSAGPVSFEADGHGRQE